MRFPKSLVLALVIAPHCFAIPLSFEQRTATHFLARFATGSVEFHPDRVILPDVTLRFLGAEAAARFEGLGPAAPSTYLRAGSARTFPQFPKLAVHSLYPGIDATFYGSGENLEYDLRIAPGVSPSRIRILLERARGIRIDESGNLVIETVSGVLEQMRPRVFQHNREISARYVLLAANQVGIRLGKHDRHSLLTIDPVLAYVKYFGGSGTITAPNAIALDAQGNIYVTGQSNSADFPTTSNSFLPTSIAPLRVISNAGQSINSLRVGTTSNVGVLGGTKDGTILYAATPDGFFLSGDSGATWRRNPLPPVPGTATPGRSLTVNAITVDSLDPATILVATNVGLYGSQSGGQSWALRDTGFPVSASGSVSVSTVFYDPANPLKAYAATSSPSYLYASSDAGNAWLPLNPTYPGEPPPPTIPFPSVVATLSSDGSVMFVVNGNGTLLKTLDRGASWVKLAQGFYGPTVIKLDPVNVNALYILDQLGLHKSTNGGLTFSNVATPMMVRQFAVDSSGTLYVAGFNQIYVSTDGGNTLAALPGLSYSINSLTAFAGNVYVGSVSPLVPFVIKLDPTGSNILYSTFLGGSAGAYPTGLAVDSQSNAVLVGNSQSTDFPFTLPVAKLPEQGQFGFVAKLSADGTHLIYATALAGSKSTTVQAVAVDSSGAAFVTGGTLSSDFPTTVRAFQPAIPAGTCPRVQTNFFVTLNTGVYAFVTKISADGSSLIYSTYLTGTCGSVAQGLTVDPAGDAIVVGFTTSPDFPVSSGSYQSAFPGHADLPSPPNTLTAGFVSKLSPAGDKLIASSYLGGGYTTQANSVTLDTAGSAYITGFTQGFAPGATPGAYQTKFVDRCAPSFGIGPSPPYSGTGDGFVLKLDTALSSPRFLTYLGGACNDSGSSIALDAAGNIWISGTTVSADFPLRDPFQAGANYTASSPGFLTELSADASALLFSSLSDSSTLALNPSGVYLAGTSANSVFVAKVDPTTTPAIHIDSVGPVTSFAPFFIAPFSTVLAPGMLIQITGRNLGPASKVNAQVDASGRLPFELSNTLVFFENIPAPLISVQASSIVCFVPFEITPTTRITVSSGGQQSNTVRISSASSAPQIISIGNEDGTANSQDHPAKAGSVIALYVSGLGLTNPLSVDGLVNSTTPAVPLAPVTVYVSGSQVTPTYVGSAPGMIAGIIQVNVRVPASIRTTDGAAAISVNSANATLYVTQ